MCLGRSFVCGLRVAVCHPRVLLTLGVVALGVMLRRCAMGFSGGLVSLGSLGVCSVWYFIFSYISPSDRTAFARVALLGE